MIHKIQHGFEALLLFITFSWQPFFATIMAAVGTWYYLAMLKKNVVNPDYKGSWRKYLKSFLKKSK